MASKGVNKVILVGNLGQDPEVRYMPNGDASCTISIATSESWKDKQTGEMRERTEWHRVVAFRRLAEIMGEYLRKGAKVYVEGSLRTRKWQDNNGQERYTTEIMANEMQMLDSRQGTGAPYGGGQPQQQPQNNYQQRPNAPKQNQQPPMQSEPDPFADFDDDIPF